MRQFRLMSLAEAIANVVVGLIIAMATQLVVFPMLSLRASLAQKSEAGARLHRRLARAELPAAAAVQLRAIAEVDFLGTALPST